MNHWHWKDFRLVFGYLKWIDKTPKTAAKLKLLRRVAVVVHHDDTLPHTALYWDLVTAFTETLGTDSVTFEIDSNNETLVFTSIALMQAFVEAHPNRVYVFDRAIFYLQGRSQAYIEVEPWHAIGGPEPYHDSWTFAIYRNFDEIDQLRSACHRVCRQHQVPIEEDIQGLQAPEKMSWLGRALRWLVT